MRASAKPSRGALSRALRPSVEEGHERGHERSVGEELQAVDLQPPRVKVHLAADPAGQERLGSAIFAFMAAGSFPTIEQAQDALCPSYTVFEPDPANAAVYRDLYPLYRKLYFAFGQKDAEPAAFGDILPEIRRIASEVRSAQ